MNKVWVVITMLLMGCAQTSNRGSELPSLNSVSLRLQPNDTEDQVIKKIGYSPNKVEFSGCGPTHSTPCKIFQYKWGGKTLYIILVSNRVVTSIKVPQDQLPLDPSQLNSSHANIENIWMVASWNVFDF